MKLKNVFFALALMGTCIGAFSVNAKNSPQSKEIIKVTKSIESTDEALYCKKSTVVNGVTYFVECWLCKCEDLKFPQA